MTGAMYSAVSGLRAHMSKLNVIGNNIANVNTYTYKAQRMTFQDSIYSTARAGANSAGTNSGGVNPSQYGYGVNVGSIDLNMASSTYSPTGYLMDCMIDGQGFFLTGDKTVNITDASDLSQLTLSRMGDFGVSDEGYIRDSRGEIIYGFMYVQNPSYDPNCNGYDGDTATYSLDDYKAIYNPTWNEEYTLSTDLVPLRLPLAAATPTEENGGYNAEDDYYYWNEGDAVFPVLTEVNASGGQTNIVPDSDATGTNGSVDVYNPSEVDPDDPTTTYPLGAGYSTTPVNSLDKAVTLESLSINENGLISGVNSDTGEEVVVGYVAIASVDNSAGVTHQGGVYYKALGGAGDIRVSILGGAADGLYLMNKSLYVMDDDGNIVYDDDGNPVLDENSNVTLLDSIISGSSTSLIPGGLEASNCDLAVEFSEMITTQRGYQANTRVVTVTDGMLEELVNMKR